MTNLNTIRQNSLPYHRKSLGEMYESSELGVIDFESNFQSHEEEHVLIDGNIFRNIYAKRAPIIFMVQSKLREVRYLMMNNVYYEVIGIRSVIFHYRQYDNTFSDMTNPMIVNYLKGHRNVDVSLIYVQNETLFNCYVENMPAAAFYKVESITNLVTFIANNISFNNNFNRHIYGLNVNYFIRNSIFTNQNLSSEWQKTIEDK